LPSEMEISPRMEGITPADLLALRPELRRLMNMILRQGEIGLAEIVLELDVSPSEGRRLLDTLVEKGYLRAFEVAGEQRYKVFLARKRRREVPLNIWEALSNKVE
jgi:DNA-binding Lrp family transcriptional regulator